MKKFEEDSFHIFVEKFSLSGGKPEQRVYLYEPDQTSVIVPTREVMTQNNLGEVCIQVAVYRINILKTLNTPLVRQSSSLPEVKAIDPTTGNPVTAFQLSEPILIDFPFTYGSDFKSNKTVCMTYSSQWGTSSCSWEYQETAGVV